MVAPTDSCAIAGLACSFGTISPVTPSTRSGTSLACTAPAHAPSAAVPLQLASPGGWRSIGPHTLVSFAPTPGSAPQLVTSDATSVAVAVDAATSGALACLFDATPTLAVLQQLDPSAAWQLIQCLLPAPDMAALPLRFITLRVVLSSGSALQNTAPSGEGASFQYAPRAPRIATTQPEVAPLWGGAVLTVSGVGFMPGDSAIACVFTSPDAWPPGAAPPPSPGNVHSSALLRCEAPAATTPPAVAAQGGDATLTVVVQSPVATLASTAVSAAVLLPTILQVPSTSRAVPALGGTGGGTGVDVAGTGFTPTGLPLQCQVRVTCGCGNCVCVRCFATEVAVRVKPSHSMHSPSHRTVWDNHHRRCGGQCHGPVVCVPRCRAAAGAFGGDALRPGCDSPEAELPVRVVQVAPDVLDTGSVTDWGPESGGGLQ